MREKGNDLCNKVDRQDQDATLNKITKNRLEFIKSKAFDSKPVAARNYRIIVSVSCKDKSIGKITTLKKTILNRFNSWKLSPIELGPQDLIDITEEIAQIEPDINQSGRKYNELELLSDQIFTDGKLVEIKDKGIEHEGFVTRGYRVKKMPESCSMSDMISLLGETVRTELPIIGRMVLSFTVATNVDVK